MAQQSDYGAYIGSTSIFSLPEPQEGATNFVPLIRQLYQVINNMALLLNIKENGFYVPNEILTNGKLFPDPTLNPSFNNTQAPTDRQIYRVIVDCGALPNAGAKNVAHNIPWAAAYKVIKILGGATDPATPMSIPLPYSSPTALNQNIKVDVGAANVTITTAINYAAYTSSFIIIEYVKS